MKPLKTHKTFGGLTQFWEHDSEVTKTKMKFSTFTPSKAPRGALIFLSGLTCTDENFITKAGAQRKLEEAGLMVICPDTSPRGLSLAGEHESDDFGSGAGFYVDATTEGYRDHYRMYSYVTNEIYDLLQKQFGVSSISISGHSMGGHGALVMALREPMKFRSVSAFSPIVNPVEAPWGQKAFKGYLGSVDAGKTYDATELVLAGHRATSQILIDQGLSDGFLERQLLTKNFEEACRSTGVKANIRMREGYDHSYYFISTFIGEHIDFHASHVKA